MFNEYEFYMHSKLKHDEMVEFANDRQSLFTINNLKSICKDQVKPTDSTPCCETQSCC